MSEKSMPGGETGAFVLIGIGAAFVISGLLKWKGGKGEKRGD